MGEDDEVRNWRATASAEVQQRLMAVSEPEVVDTWIVLHRAVTDALDALREKGVAYEEAVGMIAGSVAATMAQERPPAP
jgi:hypothetical protein